MWVQVTGLCYFGVSIAGFRAFGTSVADNVLAAFSHGPNFWVVSLANLMVVLHVAAAYQVGLAGIVTNGFRIAAVGAELFGWGLCISHGCLIGLLPPAKVQHTCTHTYTHTHTHTCAHTRTRMLNRHPDMTPACLDLDLLWPPAIMINARVYLLVLWLWASRL